ncbi:MAG TPA: glycoside hydrolase family 3 N-terminal domain-containing protein [Thermoleophilaceae bacterium]|nr:glycoside hydrolase family 3 N-terminal domain-containing protein [Thermoleophilaceae bacterium]
MRDRLPDIVSWKFVLATVATVAMLAGIVALALGLGADEEPRRAGTATVDETAPAAGSSAAGDRAKRRADESPGAQVAALAEQMPIEDRVAQLFLLGFQGQDLTAPIFEQLRERGLGGIAIDAQNYVSVDQLASMAGEAGVIAEQEGNVRPWVLAPQEGGEFNAFPDLPPATAAADLDSAAAALAESRQAARTLGDAGLSGLLGPTIDVGPPSGIAVGARAFSDDPRDVADYAKAVVDAYRAESLLTAPGHFPGLGSGSEDTRLGLSQVSASVAALRARDLAPFRAAIRAGAPAITMSNGLYVTDDFVRPGSLSSALIGGLLRRDLGFRGIVITDDLADPGVTALTTVPEAAVDAIRAGADLLYVSGPPAEQEAAYEAVLEAARSGALAAGRLKEALLRNLSVKRNYGLID